MKKKFPPPGPLKISLKSVKNDQSQKVTKPADRILGRQCMDLAETQHGNRFLIDLALCMAGILNFDRVFLVESKRCFGHV